MPERILTFGNTNSTPALFPSWGSIWAGTLVFVAVWSILGFLGLAIYASLAATGVGVGVGLWMVILAIIAMFAAGYSTGRLSGRLNAVLSGTVVFAMSALAALAVDFVSRISMSGIATTTAATQPATYSGLGWVIFLALILGWVATVSGVWSGMNRQAMQTSEEVRRVA